MPTYQYSCTECGHFFEAVQSFSEDSLTVCPECEGRLRKVFNAVGVVFKGSGFYRTDSRATADGASDGRQSAATGGEKKGGEKSGQTAGAGTPTSSGNGSSGNGSSGSGTSTTSGSSTSSAGSSSSRAASST